MKQKLGYTLLTLIGVIFIAKLFSIPWLAIGANCVSDEQTKRQYTCSFDNTIGMNEKCKCLEMKQPKPLIIQCELS